MVPEEIESKPGFLLTLSWFPGSSVGGVNQAVMSLVRVMADRGEWQPHLLVTCQSEIPAVHSHLACPVDSMYLRAPDLPARHSIRSSLSFLLHLPGALRRLERMMAARNVKVVSCYFPETESVHFVLLRWLGLYRGKVVLSFHGEDIRIMGRKGAFGQWVSRWLLRHADTVVACSRGLLQDLVAFEPACAKHARVIYNAIDIESFVAAIDRSFELPALLTGKQYLLNVARYEHKKGHDILIKAFEILTDEFPDLILVTIGTSVGEEGAGVRAMIERSPVREKILMLENVEHARTSAFIEACTVFMLPSRREGFPFVLLEAGAARTPVVAAACLGVPEIIENEVTGLLVPIEDAPALAAAAACLLRDELKRKRMADGLHDSVANDFSWNAAYDKHVSLAGVECN